MPTAGFRNIPERIANNQECNIFLIRSGEDVVAAGLYQFAIRLNDRAAIERFLLSKTSNQ
jgi:hypothetical protein